MANGIADKVDSNLAETGPIALNDDGIGRVEHDVACGVGSYDVGHDVANHAPQINWLILKGPAFVESSQEEEIFNEPPHLSAGDTNSVNGLIALIAASQLASAPEFGYAQNDRNWRTELVRRVSDELSKARF
jgi:hypothetical protein